MIAGGMMKRYFLNFILVSMLSVPLLLVGCGDKVSPGTAEVSRQTVTGIKVAPAWMSEENEVFEATGTVKAKTVSAVASKIMGTVMSVNVKEGDRVSKGALLLTIEARDISEKVNQAEAGYNEAEKGLEAAKEQKALMDTTYERYKKLYDEKAISRQEFDQIETQKKTASLEYERMKEAVKRAKAGESEAKVYGGYARITSPVSGLVAEKKIEAGSMAVPGMPLIVIEDTSSYLLELNADERLSGKFTPGTPVNVTIESTGEKIKGKVTEAVPSINPASRTFLVKISLQGANLRSGLYAKASLPVGKKQVLTVPSSAIVPKGSLTGVYTVDDKNVVTYRLVRTGSAYGDNVEILSGISPNEKIIVEGADKASDGAVIK